MKSLPCRPFRGVCVLAAVLLPAGRLPAADVTDLSWSENAGEVTITACDTAATGTLEIPSMLDGFPVRTIGSNAFRYCDKLESVVLPDSVTSIASYAFIFCEGLTSVTLGSGVESIGFRAFYACTALPGITIPASVSSIQTDAFTRCEQLLDIVVDAANPDYESVGGVLFTAGPTALVAYPNARAGSYSVPAGVTGILKNAFTGSDGLTAVELPASLSGIEPEAFGGCPGLTALEVAPGNATYQDIDGVLFDATGTVLHTFPGGRGGRYVVPPGVTAIGDWAFTSCWELSEVSLPSSLTEIRYEAFEDARGLRRLIIPDSVSSIERGAFSDCRGLLEVRIPSGITTLPTYTFYDCESLGRVTIPAGVTTLGYAVFAECKSLDCVTFEGPAPSSVDSAVFDGVAPNPVAMVDPADAASFGGLGATWNGLLVIEKRELRIVGMGRAGENLYLDVADGTAGLKVTAAASLGASFTEVAGVTETGDAGGQPNRFLVPAASLPAGRAFVRAELDP